MVNYLTGEKPIAVLDFVSKPNESCRVDGYVLNTGEYRLCYFRNIPIITAAVADSHKLVAELSPGTVDAIYAFGGRTIVAPPSVDTPNLICIHDEQASDNYCHWLLDWLPRLIMI